MNLGDSADDDCVFAGYALDRDEVASEHLVEAALKLRGGAF